MSEPLRERITEADVIITCCPDDESKDTATYVLATMRRLGFTITPPAPPETPSAREEREKQEADESRFYCPHCHAYKPDHLFTMHAANLAGIGTLQWITAICGKCRVVLAEMPVGYRPDEDLLRAVQAGGGRQPRILS